jgi:hypothetical protein
MIDKDILCNLRNVKDEFFVEKLSLIKNFDNYLIKSSHSLLQ